MRIERRCARLKKVGTPGDQNAASGKRITSSSMVSTMVRVTVRYGRRSRAKNVAVATLPDRTPRRQPTPPGGQGRVRDLGLHQQAPADHQIAEAQQELHRGKADAVDASGSSEAAIR